MDVNRADGTVDGPAPDLPPPAGAAAGRSTRRLGPVLLLAVVSAAVAMTLSHPHGTEAAFTVRATTPPLEVVGPSPEASGSPSPSPSPSSTPSPAPSAEPTGGAEPDGGGSTPDAGPPQEPGGGSPGPPEASGEDWTDEEARQPDGYEGSGHSGGGDFSHDGYPRVSAGLFL